MRFLVPLIVAGAIAISGCTGVRPLPALSESQLQLATLRGMDQDLEVRFWGDVAPGSIGA